MSAVRSALLEVKGVTRVQVSLETSEAIVTYDPPATTQAMISAVAAAAPVGPLPYKATVKVAPQPGGSGR
ncbi:MAG: heavy metal-associated domain-containing protein [Acidobacteriota bacterium]|nr:heavy metal-associated domain-containing protein [Acidobacteriota bacterium]